LGQSVSPEEGSADPVNPAAPQTLISCCGSRDNAVDVVWQIYWCHAYLKSKARMGLFKTGPNATTTDFNPAGLPDTRMSDVITRSARLSAQWLWSVFISERACV
jgi:hypothetical protein